MMMMVMNNGGFYKFPRITVAVADLGGDRGVQWNPPFGRVLRNYEGFVVVLRVIGALAIVYVTLSLSALAFAMMMMMMMMMIDD